MMKLGIGIALSLFIQPCIAETPIQPVELILKSGHRNAELAPCFLGLSYESSMLLAKAGKYYFDTNDQALLNTFKTLGIKSLRVGANAVDDPRVPVPQQKDIDTLFQFARAAGVKVIYSFRLKNGNPAESARLARYISDHYADVLDSFAIGNEPNLYSKPHPTYEDIFRLWKPHYDAILKAVPNAKIEGLSATGLFALNLAKDIAAEGHLAMATDHYYFLGSGRAAETNPPASRACFLSNRLHDDYEKDYQQVGALLAAKGVHYRIDEMNSCYNGGAKDSSDTYAATLWALDCIHWWAAHNILGVNFHTGESVGRDGIFGAPNYAAFLRQSTGQGFVMRPEAYAFLTFSQGAHGCPMEVDFQANPNFDFDAYAYHDLDGGIYLTLINKTYGKNAKCADVSLRMPINQEMGTWQRMNLTQKEGDVAAKQNITLSDKIINQDGTWLGDWESIHWKEPGRLAISVAPATAAILRFYPTKPLNLGMNHPNASGLTANP